MFRLCLPPEYRYTLDPFDEAAAGTSGCTKLHLVAAAIDPRTKAMTGVRRNIRDSAFRCLEYLGAQVIDEKLAAEFGAFRSGPLSPDRTSSASDNEDGPREDDAPASAKKKSLLSEVVNLSDDEQVSKWKLPCFSLFLPSPLPRPLLRSSVPSPPNFARSQTS